MNSFYLIKNLFIFLLQQTNQYQTSESVVDLKPPIKVTLERMHILRQSDGHILIQPSENES